MAVSVITATQELCSDGNGHLSAGAQPDGFADITDCCFVVQGVELRVHSQVPKIYAPPLCAFPHPAVVSYSGTP
jgi:hypothetical protein